MGQGKCIYDGLKDHKIVSKILVKKISNFFSTLNYRKTANQCPKPSVTMLSICQVFAIGSVGMALNSIGVDDDSNTWIYAVDKAYAFQNQRLITWNFLNFFRIP